MTSSQSSSLRFIENEKVLCFHGPLIYEAKVNKVRTVSKKSDTPNIIYEGQFFTTIFSYTLETAYKVDTCPRGNLRYMRIYLITDLKLLWKGILGLNFIYFIGDLTL